MNEKRKNESQMKLYISLFEIDSLIEGRKEGVDGWMNGLQYHGQHWPPPLHSFHSGEETVRNHGANAAHTT